MQEKNLYEYAIIRIVPRVEREEFLNVGVLLYCTKQKKVHIKFHLLNDRIQLLCSTTNSEEILHYLQNYYS